MKCDFCGKELKETKGATIRVVRGLLKPEINDLLCEDCEDEFIKEYKKLKNNRNQVVKQDNLKDIKYLLYCTLGGIIGGIIPNVVKWLFF